MKQCALLTVVWTLKDFSWLHAVMCTVKVVMAGKCYYRPLIGSDEKAIELCQF